MLGELKRALAFDGVDQDKEAGDKEEGGPADLAGELEGVGAGADGYGRGDDEGGEAGGKAEVFAQGGGGEEQGDHKGEADEDELAVGGEWSGVDFTVDGLAEVFAEDEAHDQVGCCDGEDGWDAEAGEPAREGRHVRVEDDEVGGVGDGEDEAGRVGDEGADEEVGEWGDFGLADGGEDGGSEDDGGGVVGHEDGDERANGVDEEEEARATAPGFADGDGGDPVEDALPAGELAEEHHADEEEIDVGAFGDGGAGELEGDEAEGEEQDCASGDPPDLGDVARAYEHEQDAGGDDQRKQDVGERRGHVLWFLGRVVGLGARTLTVGGGRYLLWAVYRIGQSCKPGRGKLQECIAIW